jgi:hypothetical protein
MLCHIVTGLRHLLFRVASMHVSQASVAEMLQKFSGPAGRMGLEAQNKRPPRPAADEQFNPRVVLQLGR